MTARLVLLVLGLCLLAAAPAYAHDCASQADCEQTTGYINGISVIGGIIAILTGVLGSQLGGPIGGAVGGGATAATAPPPPDTGEAEVPPDDRIGATPPPETGGDEGWIDELLSGEPVGVEHGEPAEEDPLAGEPGIDELVPIDDLLAPEGPVEGPEAPETVAPDEAKEPETVKPPILEITESGTDLVGGAKDLADTVKDLGEDVGDAVGQAKDVMEALGDSVSDPTRKTVNDALDRIGDAASGMKDLAEQAGEVAGQVKDVGEKAGEYMNALNENLERTERLGLTDDSRDFLGWWRVTIKAAGELTERFVDGLTEPVTKLFGDEYGEKAQDLLHDAVPIKEFGEELSKLPTSAAEHVVNASQRDQVAENVDLVPKGDAGYVELDDLFPGRKWP